jgi:hypothetical protein
MECVPIKLYFVYWPTRKTFFPRYYVDYKLIKKDKEYIYYYRYGQYRFEDYKEQRGTLIFDRNTNKITTEEMQLHRAELYMKKTYGNNTGITRKFLTQYLSNLEKGEWLGRQLTWLNEKINNEEFPNDSQTDDNFVKDMMDRMETLELYGIDVYPNDSQDMMDRMEALEMYSIDLYPSVRGINIKL